MQSDIDVGGAELNKSRLLASALLAGALLAPSVSRSAVGFAAAGAAGAALAGTGSARTGDFTPSTSGLSSPEFPQGLDSAGGPAGFQGSIIDRSLSKAHGEDGGSSGAQGDQGDGGVAGPRFVTGWEGLNHFQQRYARGGNQFSLEPPDQGLCVGNGHVVEVINDVINVFDTSGKSQLPDTTASNVVAGFPTDVNHAVDLNSFFGYPPAITRSRPPVFGQFVTDPSCLYDAATNRFFVDALTLETFATGPRAGHFTHVNHIDLAVSKTGDPTVANNWNIYHVDVTNDGTNPDPSNACPCLGDYPHMGADANGIYITTNSYPWVGNGFDGAQIYAFSKQQLAAGAASVAMQHINTFGKVNAPSDAGKTQPGFTLWPSQSPAGGSNNQGEDRVAGTEMFLSSNAADEANVPVAGSGGPHTSHQLIVWSLSNTGSLNSTTPNLTLANQILNVGQYAVPPQAPHGQQQPGFGTAPTQAAPQGFCINDTTTVTVAGVGCWNLLFVKEPKHTEVIAQPDTNDTRMQQVTFADGKLFGALDTELTVGGEHRAGVEWFVVDVSDDGARVSRNGYLGAAGMDFAYPAIGVTQDGRGVMAFTATGGTTFESAAFAPFDANRGVGKWSIVNGGKGAAQDDGFTGYASQVAPDSIRSRWGDYGAAAVVGNSIWIASEYIADACSYKDWGGRFFGATSGDNKLGTCAASPGAPGKRTALANWSTRISQFNFEGGN